MGHYCRCFYEKGFYIDEDYYNGVNVAFLHLVIANETKDKNETISGFMQSQKIYKKVIEVCNALIRSKSFHDRGDRLWIYQSNAQAY